MINNKKIFDFYNKRYIEPKLKKEIECYEILINFFKEFNEFELLNIHFNPRKLVRLNDFSKSDYYEFNYKYLLCFHLQENVNMLIDLLSLIYKKFTIYFYKRICKFFLYHCLLSINVIKTITKFSKENNHNYFIKNIIIKILFNEYNKKEYDIFKVNVHYKKNKLYIFGL